MTIDYAAKCKRRRSDGPTPCLCCPGECTGDPQTFAGMPVVLQHPLIVQRTWKERLFTRPWQPTVRTRVIPPAIPEGQVIRVNDTWIMTVRTWDGLKRELDLLPPNKPRQLGLHFEDSLYSPNSLYNVEISC